ncbi:hypothetical protein [Saccharopolyspora pogona]|nr:hypothetical protein [Saccharopolyspora pogona]
MLLQPAYPGVTNTPAIPHPQPTNNQDNDVEILTPHHQITLMKRQTR